MADVTKQLLSGSIDGKFITITSTASGSPNTLHTALTSVTGFDEIWVWATNKSASADVVLTISWGTALESSIVQTIAARSGLQIVVPGLILQNANVITAWASLANQVLINGFVNRIV